MMVKCQRSSFNSAQGSCGPQCHRASRGGRPTGWSAGGARGWRCCLSWLMECPTSLWAKPGAEERPSELQRLFYSFGLAAPGVSCPLFPVIVLTMTARGSLSQGEKSGNQALPSSRNKLRWVADTGHHRVTWGGGHLCSAQRPGVHVCSQITLVVHVGFSECCVSSSQPSVMWGARRRDSIPSCQAELCLKKEQKSQPREFPRF